MTSGHDKIEVVHGMNNDPTPQAHIKKWHKKEKPGGEEEDVGLGGWLLVGHDVGCGVQLVWLHGFRGLARTPTKPSPAESMG